MKNEVDGQLLAHLYDIAYRAHTGTSFNPDKRAVDAIKSHSAELQGDLDGMAEHEREGYRASYEKHFTRWMGAKSNCVSTMIAGGSNFNVRRAEKANASEHKRCTEFIDWRKNALAAIGKRIERNRPQAEKDNDEFLRVSKQILSSAATIIGIDNGTVRGCSRPLFVSNLVNRLKTIAKNGNSELLIKCLELIRKINAENKKPIISASNSIWKLGEIAEAKREQLADKAGTEDEQYPFDGGAVIINHAMDRVQIRHDAKPARAVIDELKRNAFKWSPTGQCWQRQLTPNARYAAGRLTGVAL